MKMKKILAAGCLLVVCLAAAGCRDRSGEKKVTITEKADAAVQEEETWTDGTSESEAHVSAVSPVPSAAVSAGNEEKEETKAEEDASGSSKEHVTHEKPEKTGKPQTAQSTQNGWSTLKPDSVAASSEDEEEEEEEDKENRSGSESDTEKTESDEVSAVSEKDDDTEEREEESSAVSSGSEEDAEAETEETLTDLTGAFLSEDGRYIGIADPDGSLEENPRTDLLYIEKIEISEEGLLLYGGLRRVSETDSSSLAGYFGEPIIIPVNETTAFLTGRAGGAHTDYTADEFEEMFDSMEAMAVVIQMKDGSAVWVSYSS